MSRTQTVSDDLDGEYDSIPEELQDRPQWLMWDESADTPRRPHWNGDFGISWSDPDDWHTFEEAIEAAKERESWGIGYVMALENDDYPRGLYGCLDLDGCLREAHQEKPKDWLPEIQKFTDSGAYIEYSASGEGLHIPFVGHEIPEWWADCQLGEHEGVDVLTNKFCAFTGNQLSVSGDSATEADPTQFLFDAYQEINGEAPSLSPSGDAESVDYDGDEWLDESDIEDALSHIKPDCGYDHWLKLGFAVHDWDSGPSGKRLFEQWSKGGSKWDTQAMRNIEAIWSTASEGDGVTVGTLVHSAKEAGWDVPNRSNPKGGTRQNTPTKPLVEAIDSSWFDKSDKTVTVQPVESYPAGELADVFQNPSNILEACGHEAIRAIGEIDAGGQFLDDAGDGWTVEAGKEDAYAHLEPLSTREIKNTALAELPTHRIAYLPKREIWLWCDDGVWNLNGDGEIRKWLDEYLGPYYSGHIRREVMDQLQARSQVKEQRFGGGPPGQIAAENGLIDLDAGEITREIQPSDHIRWTLATEHDPTADCPKWREFLGEVVEASDIPLLQEYIGYCLRHWDVKRKKALMLLGPTDAGKSVFVDVIEALFGGEDSAATSSTSVQYLANERWGPARLVNTALNTRSDLGEGSIENTGKVKELIAGDSLDAERKRKPVFQFKPTAKHIFAANRAPNRSVDDEAFWNRWLTVVFPQAIPNDEQIDDLDEQLLEELPGILNWAIEGYQRLEEQGRFTNEPLPYQNREKWERYGNSISQWFDRCTEEEPDGFTPKESTGEALGAYDSYVAYARQNGLEVETDSKFTSELKRRDGVSKTRRRIDGTLRYGYNGFVLTDDAPGGSDPQENSSRNAGIDSFK
ncbi:phage/plasmid primase, P4 family [Haloarcula sp. S1CR25-12]|uniref:Phage/plasmid primase, P4 family n=1 Tax=Haloarcula saliterrae TaxID=2950534 RepID=A0ABU2F8N5_9EURY|nr:phage/plasmid primase, P4 family [Haloarcula sp. S1CR25-12]MDS0258614.1 phage/plasmid primase, P4 family [Haloarcula sp. S1CR25-12]